MGVKIQPLADFVVAQQEEATNKTASGIYLPEKAAEKPKTAKVLAVGKKVDDIKVGDRIIYKSYSSTDIKIEDQEYLIIDEDDVLAIVK